MNPNHYPLDHWNAKTSDNLEYCYDDRNLTNAKRGA